MYIVDRVFGRRPPASAAAPAGKGDHVVDVRILADVAGELVQQVDPSSETTYPDRP